MTNRISTFRLNAKSFINISSDNRLHLWDIDTRQEKRSYVERNHLEHTYTCFASWNNPKAETDLGYFAVGTSNGTVIVWDFSRGIILKTIGVAKESPVPTDIVFSSDGKSIFVSSSQSHVISYSVATGEQLRSYKGGKKGNLKLALNPKANVLAVARWDLI